MQVNTAWAAFADDVPEQLRAVIFSCASNTLTVSCFDTDSVPWGELTDLANLVDESFFAHRNERHQWARL